MPVNEVFAGTYNLNSQHLRPRHDQKFVVNKIIKLVRDAQDNQGHTQTRIEKN